MDRGIPTEEVLTEMRNAETPTCYLVGTPRGRLSQLEKDFLSQPWADVRDAVHVQYLPGHLAGFPQINDRVHDVLHIGDLP